MPDEKIQLFYALGVYRLEGFVLLTDKALILWGEPFGTEQHPSATRLTFEEISSIAVLPPASWAESLVAVDAGEWTYTFPLGSFGGGDRRFVERLESATGLTSDRFEEETEELEPSNSLGR